MEKTELSFIIPVYNGAKTMEACIGSIQKCRIEHEIIIVNDGSTDNTEAICTNMAKQDAGIKVYTIENCGQGKARVYGTKQAKGKYICYVDADDYIFPEAYEKMWKCASINDYDVVMGGYVRDNGIIKEEIQLPGEGIIKRNGNKMQRQLYQKVKTGSAFGYVWNKLYKRKFLEENKLQMDDIRKVYMEDTMFNLKVWSKSPSWYCMNIPVYCYQTAEESTTRKAEPLIHEKNIAMISGLVDYLQSNCGVEENIDVIVPLILRTFCWSLQKNTLYEGNDFRKMKMRAEAYIDNKVIQSMLKQKHAFKSLWQIPSVLQSVFYSVCYGLMRFRLKGAVAGIFWCLSPFMRIYVGKVVK